ncbi:hypothetical protein CEXT_686191 [Caerostris extrusa]|uniref:Uncharacterized protein n=1 Tax=Caerostris extrusa TaxID=172846 RepID=A0AAV4YDS8_CAEEX|nr:hypothetical protein CEXT_686191 [Caerostris extrusa]
MKTEPAKENPYVSEFSILETQFKDKFERMASCQEDVENVILECGEYSEETYEEWISTGEEMIILACTFGIDLNTKILFTEKLSGIPAIVVLTLFLWRPRTLYKRTISYVYQ